jgi:hypothetical protein
VRLIAEDGDLEVVVVPQDLFDAGHACHTVSSYYQVRHAATSANCLE